MRPRLLICDIDGTLVDSAAGVIDCVRAAFGQQGLAPPAAQAIREAIGLSLDEMFARLDPAAHARYGAALVSAYRLAYRQLRESRGSEASSPLFPGARAALEALNADSVTLLGIATGKSRRGVAALMTDHGLGHLFATIQTADTHPSKPSPSMILQALADTGVEPGRAVMLGDTIHDVEMAKSAGVRAISVGWGYHDATRIGADRTIARFDDLGAVFDNLMEAR